MTYECLICKSERTSRIYRKGDLCLAECHHCGFIQQDPMPGLDDLDAEYQDESHYMEEILQTKDVFLERDRRALQELSRMGAKGPLLDIGAGAGTLLQAGIEMGWEAAGLEISRPSAEHLRSTFNVEVFDRPLEEANIPKERFGVVTFSHSLEHVADPVQALRHAAEALVPGGMVHIAVPNWRAGKRQVTGLKVSWIYSHHLCYFEKDTLALALETAGFEPCRWSFHPLIGLDYPFVIALFRTWRLEELIQRFLHMGANPLETLVGDDVKINCPTWRFRTVFRLARILLKLWPENFLARVGKSEEVRVTAVKKS
ncbi:MAG: class I SAM-dependent methyltransferase [Planctomycetes bacterium]|nr:class I SAM-dependent methyltransferase [Planctomycetota bacterium]